MIETINPEACLCDCETACSCVSLETFRKLALSNISADLFWGGAGTNYWVVRPALGQKQPIVCFPGPQYAAGEKCEYQADGRYHCDHGTHGTWTPDTNGLPPDPATARYDIDGTFTTPSGGSGTWTHADGSVPVTAHTGFSCAINDDGVTFTCSDGTTGNIGTLNGNTTTFPNSPLLGPASGTTCNYDPTLGTYVCTDGTGGSYSSGQPTYPGLSTPAPTPEVASNPNVQCVYTESGAFICDDGTFGWASGASGSAGVAAGIDGPSATCTWQSNGSWICPDGSYGHWFPSYAAEATQVGPPTAGGSDPDFPYAECTFNPTDGTYSCPDGSQGFWYAAQQGGIVQDPVSSACTYAGDGRFNCPDGSYGFYLPLIIHPSDPPSPPQPENCTYYADGSFVCKDSATGTWLSTTPSSVTDPTTFEMPDLSQCELIPSQLSTEPNRFVCPNGVTGTYLNPHHSVVDEAGNAIPIPVPTGPVAATQGNDVATPTETATPTPFGTPPAAPVPFAPSPPPPTVTPTPLPYIEDEAGRRRYDYAAVTPTPTITPPSPPEAVTPSSPTRCIFDAGGTYICTDGVTGTWQPDASQLNQFDPPPDTKQCTFNADFTYTCENGNRGSWRKNPIYQSAEAPTGVNPDDFGTGCLFFSDGTFACPRSSAEIDASLYPYQTGYWRSYEQAGNCYFFPDGEFRCDNGSYGRYKTKRDDNLNSILGQGSVLNNDVDGCVYITGDYGSADFTGYDPRDGTYQGGFYNLGNPANRNYTDRQGVFLCDVRHSLPGTPDAESEALQQPSYPVVSDASGNMEGWNYDPPPGTTGSSYGPLRHDYEDATFYKGSTVDAEGNREDCVLIRDENGMAGQWACGDEARIMGTWENVLGVPLAGPSMSACEMKADGRFTCPDGSSGYWNENSEQVYETWRESPQTEFENFVPRADSDVLDNPGLPPPLPTSDTILDDDGDPVAVDPLEQSDPSDPF